MNQNNETIVETKSGKIQGSYEDGLYVFRGIPYAAPPVVEQRWLPPEPVEPWQGIRRALAFGAIAPQSTGSLFVMRQPQVEEPQNEDCLFLNVWSPRLGDTGRPVMVWIHGGAFSRGSGSSPMHPGSTLPKRGGVVMVSINYRLGPLGFLHLDRVTDGKIPATGNEGLLDQIAALQWVNENIAAFGGDPNNITVFGESAGAMSIGCLLAMPRAKGLFQKAILQSGANTFRPLEHAIQVSKQFLELLDVEPEACEALRTITAERLVVEQPTQQELGSGESMANIRGATMEPVVDGKVLPDIPLDAVKKGSADKVTVLTGSNLDEAKLFAMMNPSMKNLDETGLMKRTQRLVSAEHAAGLVEKYQKLLPKRGKPVSKADILTAIQTDQQFRIPDVRLAEIQNSLGLPSYSYLFTWESPVAELAACHALDVGFVFGNLEENFHGSGPAADRLALNMQDAWIAFARTGNPSCESMGEWPVYGDARKTMILGKSCFVEEAPYEEERRAWDDIPNSLLG